MRSRAPPSWSAQVTLIGGMKPAMPSSFMRSSVMSRFSSPQRTCSPVSGLLAELALRGADRLDDEHGVDQAAIVEDLADLVALGLALALVVDVFRMSSNTGKSVPDGIEAGRLVALGRLARRASTSGSAPDHQTPMNWSIG